MYYYRLPQTPVYSVYADMLRQTHLLIAGATGSGKSTVLNALLCTMLHRAPTEIKFIILDRKCTTLKPFMAAPHCIRHAREPAEMLLTLRQTIQLMNDRFLYMEEAEHNDFSDIYLIIDELADLMTTRKRDAAPLLQTLGQLAREAKIHLLCCTQSPLREIIPTPIKCNFPARVALKTATRQDSRNIIDMAGAEALPDPQTEHRADCLYRHGAITEHVINLPQIDDSERAELIQFWRTALQHYDGIRH